MQSYQCNTCSWWRLPSIDIRFCNLLSCTRIAEKFKEIQISLLNATAPISKINSISFKKTTIKDSLQLNCYCRIWISKMYRYITTRIWTVETNMCRKEYRIDWFQDIKTYAETHTSSVLSKFSVHESWWSSTQTDL